MNVDPPWLDDPSLSIALDRLRASLEHHAATERAEGRAGPVEAFRPATTKRKHRPHADQTALFELPGDRER